MRPSRSTQRIARKLASELLCLLPKWGGRPLTGGGYELRKLRKLVRKAKALPEGDPLRETVEEWERVREAAGPVFAVPPDWKP